MKQPSPPVTLAATVVMYATAVLCLDAPPAPSELPDGTAAGSLRWGAWWRRDLALMTDHAPDVPRTTPPAGPWDAARVVEALGACSGGQPCDLAALAVHLDSLPARVTHVRLPTATDTSPAVVVPVAALRAVVAPQAAREPVTLYRTLARPPDSPQMRPAVVFRSASWAALLVGLPRAEAERADEAQSVASFKHDRPVALACAACGTVHSYHATEHDARERAVARRWSRRETDEGTVYTCAPCTRAQTTAGVA